MYSSPMITEGGVNTHRVKRVFSCIYKVSHVHAHLCIRVMLKCIWLKLDTGNSLRLLAADACVESSNVKASPEQKDLTLASPHWTH